MSDWQNVQVIAREAVKGVLWLLVLQALAAITTILVNVIKWLKGRRVVVQEARQVTTWKYRRVWLKASEYQPETDPYHPNFESSK